MGLSEEIRAVSRLDQRLSEAEKLGFAEMYISQFNARGLDLSRYGIRVHPSGRLDEVLAGLFG
ncbi:hypothetical protein [Hymenobacter lutimineralis]|uniref:hypothetical protein n=1 Tax=Hymenobacter lutimineralis TaxID=2606448 RepID=UPI0016562667|nr:hypothetical protein [Hymenobacter lutimineralis]